MRARGGQYAVESLLLYWLRACFKRPVEMFIYLSKEIAIPNGVKLKCISWNPKRRRQRPAQGRTRRGALASISL
jgi:hypothetical protein